jgi:type VI secretion system secreted protein VgrG
MRRHDLCQLVVVIDGVELLGSTFHLQEALSEPYACDIVVQQGPIDPKRLPGSACHIRLSRGMFRRELKGIVRAVDDLGLDGWGRRRLRLHVVPEFWLLSQRVTSRCFEQKNLLEVLEAVFASAGVYPLGIAFMPPQTHLQRRDFWVQFQETDLAFVSRLLEEAGLTYLFQCQDGVERFVVTEGGVHPRSVETDPVLVSSPDQARFRIEVASEVRPQRVTLVDFDPASPLRPVTHGHALEGASERHLHMYPARSVRVSGGVARYNERAARLVLEAEQVAGQLVHAAGAYIHLWPGARINLSTHGGPPEDLLVTRVVHALSVDPPSTPDATVEGAPSNYLNTFECVPSVPGRTVYRPPLKTPRPVVTGIQTATVVGAPDGQVCEDPTGAGRVRLRFHWELQPLAPEQSVAWVRTMQGPWAGAGWGFQFVPRHGMEVAVAFVDGDPDRPVVLGALHNGLNQLPTPSSPLTSGIRTRSVPSDPGDACYNELRFEDLAGAEQVALRAQRDLNVRVLHDHVSEVEGARVETIVGGRLSTIKGPDIARAKGPWLTEVECPVKLSSSQRLALEVLPSTLLMEGERMVLTAPRQLELHCGRSSIDLADDRIVLATSGGARIELIGSTVRISASTVELSAEGAVSVLGSPVKLNC